MIEEQLWLPMDYTQPDKRISEPFGNCCGRDDWVQFEPDKVGD
jgi:hypothetical protein